MNNHYIAEHGKVWKSKTTGDVLSEQLYLGINDSIENYEQVDASKIIVEGGTDE